MADLTGQVLAGNYRVGLKLGRGGMGSVYEAEQLNIGRTVALKIVHDHLRTKGETLVRLKREARAAAALNHPNIVNITDFVHEPQGACFLVMERLYGMSAGEAVQQSGPFSPERTVRIGIQILEGLGAAHEAGIIHRDMKPDNVFLTKAHGLDDVVKLLDFGIAKLWGKDTGIQLTVDGQVLGTPQYMSPEQALGQPVDIRTDIYAVGATLYRLLSGHVLFEQDTLPGLIAAITTEAPRPLPVDPGLDAIIARALEKAPEARWSSAAEMAQALRDWQSHATKQPGGVRTVRGPAFDGRPAPIPDDPTTIPLVREAARAVPVVASPTPEPRFSVPASVGVPRRRSTLAMFVMGGGLLVFACAAAVLVIALAMGKIRFGDEPDGPVAQTETEVPEVPPVEPEPVPTDVPVEAVDTAPAAAPVEPVEHGSKREPGPRPRVFQTPPEPEPPPDPPPPEAPPSTAILFDFVAVQGVGSGAAQRRVANARRTAIGGCFRGASTEAGRVVQFQVWLNADGTPWAADESQPRVSNAALRRCLEGVLERSGWGAPEGASGSIRVAYRYGG